MPAGHAALRSAVLDRRAQQPDVNDPARVTPKPENHVVARASWSTNPESLAPALQRMPLLTASASREAPTAPQVRKRLDTASVVALQRTAGNRAVRQLIQRVTFTPGTAHDHTPCGSWWRIQLAPNSGWKEDLICSTNPPLGVVGMAILAEFRDKPLALDHLGWYMSTGGGADYNENGPLEQMLRTDAGVHSAILSTLPSPAPASGTVPAHLKVEQSDYTNQDFRFAFGAIDRLDLEADYGAGTLHAWFQDRYEWHPYYPGLYTAFSDDAARETNCVHAALVELQASGAADFWMKGEATVPLSVLGAGAAPSTGGGGSSGSS